MTHPLTPYLEKLAHDMPLQISNRKARRLVLSLQGLNENRAARMTPELFSATIRQIGFVQIDSIQWVERAHHMILHARNQNYRPDDLHHQIEKKRSLFENYTHDASVIPVELFKYWRHKFSDNRPRLRERLIAWQGDGFLDHCDRLLEMIETSGPVRSRDLERPASKGPKEMWQWHDGKAALEFLWWTGELGIAARDGFQKVYDLSKRVIPAKHFRKTVSREAFVRWACLDAIERLGFGSPRDIARFWNVIKLPECRAWLKGPGAGELVEVEVETADGTAPKKLLARPDIESLLAGTGAPSSRLRILSPFDPVTRDRDRLQWLFNFDYRIEIYVPAAKRKYGYYIFPVLEGDHVVGRIDMRADRKKDELTVSKIWWEPGHKPDPARKKKLTSELERQAALAGVSGIRCPAKVLRGTSN